MGDVFADADAYEAYMGRWSRLVAPLFVAWLGAPAGLRWLDVGCGTGSLTEALVAGATPASVRAIDRSEAFVAAARRAVADGRVSVEVATADPLPLPDRTVDAAISGLVLNFLPDVPAAVREQTRVVAPGGLVAAFVWDYAEGMEPLRLFWDAAATVDPGRADLDEGVRFPICRPDALATAWQGAGLTDVAVEGLVVHRVFASFDELWAPFLGGQGAGGGYLATLDGPTRDGIGDALRARVPAGEHGSIRLAARAWAVRGRRPDGSPTSGGRATVHSGAPTRARAEVRR